MLSKRRRDVCLGSSEWRGANPERGSCRWNGDPRPNRPGSLRIADDTTGRANVPVGFGTLRQDEIAIRLELQGLIVRAIPLDENLIRLLTPDSYRALRELQESNKQSIAAVTRRTGGRAPDLWYVSFYGVEPDVHFSPMELVITSAGRDFRALEVLPLSTVFWRARLRQRETQSAIYLFDESIVSISPCR